MLLGGISIIGIVGSVQESIGSTPDALSQAGKLQIVSSALFCVVVLSIFVAIGVYTVCRFKKGEPFQKVVFVLCLFMVCISIETVYRVWSSASLSGFITEEAAIDVLIFMPEVIIVLTWLSVDLNDIKHIKWVFFSTQGGKQRSNDDYILDIANKS
jgi:hypothetical protein